MIKAPQLHVEKVRIGYGCYDLRDHLQGRSERDGRGRRLIVRRISSPGRVSLNSGSQLGGTLLRVKPIHCNRSRETPIREGPTARCFKGVNLIVLVTRKLRVSLERIIDEGVVPASGCDVRYDKLGGVEGLREGSADRNSGQPRLA